MRLDQVRIGSGEFGERVDGCDVDGRSVLSVHLTARVVRDGGDDRRERTGEIDTVAGSFPGVPRAEVCRRWVGKVGMRLSEHRPTKILATS